MAGGPNAAVVPCMKCFGRAVRTSEGLENDAYRCEAGHAFLVDWTYDGPPKEPRWPPTDEERARFEVMKKFLG